MPTAAQSKAAPKAAPAASKKQYRNGTKFNIFTGSGRCMPGQTVEMTEDEAKRYKGLDLCQ